MHGEALTKEAKKLFPHCSRFKKFYLAGGTALALHIGHRISVDLDLFSQEPLSPRLLSQAKRLFSASSTAVAYRSPEQLDIFVDGVKMTFLHFPYPLIKRLSSMGKVPVADIHEIAAMKAFSIGKRLSYKDYIDWYFMLNEQHVTLRQVISDAQKKFKGDFNDRLFLGQLVSMEEIPTQKINFLRDPVARTTLQNFLKKTVRGFAL